MRLSLKGEYDDTATVGRASSSTGPVPRKSPAGSISNVKRLHGYPDSSPIGSIARVSKDSEETSKTKSSKDVDFDNYMSSISDIAIPKSSKYNKYTSKK